MDIQNQQTPTPVKKPSQPIQSSSTTSSLKKKIMCKFFIMGNCSKGDNCPYLHSEEEKTKMISKPSIECPMYNLGCCKNGPMCKYQHVKSDINTQIKDESIAEYPELPIWYLEHYFDKPIELIFADLERQNPQEVKELKEKYGMNSNKKKQYSNYQYDVYADKKDNIIYHLNQNINYYLVKCANYSSIRFSMEHNMIIIPNAFIEKFDEERRQRDNIILVIFDMENMNYSGFVLFKKKIESNEELINSMRHNKDKDSKNQQSQLEVLKEGFNYIKIEWLWRTKLHYTKLAHRINPFNTIQAYCEELSLDIGYYACRMMIKRLSKDEVRDLVKQKQSHDDEEENYVNNTKADQSLCSQELILPPATHHFQQIIHSQSEDKKVYVTNINNLQVNINSNAMNGYDNTQLNNQYQYQNQYQRRKRERSRSRSNPKYEQRRDYDKRYYSNSNSSYNNNSYNYNHSNHKNYTNGNHYYKDRDYNDQYQPQVNYNRDNNRPNKAYLSKDSELNHHKSYKNKLFSNAMDKLNSNSNRRR